MKATLSGRFLFKEQMTEHSFTAEDQEFCRRCGVSRHLSEDDPDIRREGCRPTWAKSWMEVAQIVSLRSYDRRLRVGTVIVSADNTQVLSVGYNGNFRGGPHQHESIEPGKSGFIHAEVNALVKCNYGFHKPKHMYITHSPCKDCAKLILNADIARLVYNVKYRDSAGIDLLESCGLEVLSFEEADALERQTK